MDVITQTGPYIPDDDAGANVWLTNFAERIAADPAAVGLSAADAALLTALAEAYDAALKRTNDPRQRTPVNIAEKDEARNAAISAARMYAMQIKANRGIDDPKKIALGIHVGPRGRTPIGAPINEPMLDIVGSYSGRHTLRFHDAATPTSSRKAWGATHLLVFAAIADDAVDDPEEARFVGAITRQPFDVTFEASRHAGKTATYFGRWLTAKGLMGPWSLPVSMSIPFGSNERRDAGESPDEPSLSLAA